MSRITMLEYGFVLLLSTLSGSVVSGAEETQTQSVIVTPFQPILYGQKNGRLVVDCHITSQSPVQIYEWFKDGEKLLPQKRVYIARNGSLIFGKLVSKKRKSDTGRYECFASNAFGTVIGAQVNLQIEKRSAVVVPKNLEVEVGGVARFQCSVTPSTSLSSYLWAFKGRALETTKVHNDRIVTSGGVLQIYNVTSADEGLYYCTAFKHGDDIDLLEESAFLKIKSGPLTKESRLLNTPQNITVINQEPALLECLVQGQEPVIISWNYPNGSTVVPSQHVKLTGGSNLLIPKTTRTDAGVYTCIISHRNGSETSHLYNLSIHVAPTFTNVPLLVQNLNIAQRARLFCEVSGHPQPNITWYKDGLKLFPPPGVKISDELVLHGFFEDSGYYQCVANNSVKTVMASSYVNFIRKDETPEKVQNVVATPSSATSVRLSWSAARTLDSNPVVAYVAHYHEVHDFECPGPCNYIYERQREVTQKTDLDIKGLKPFTEYSFGVQGFSTLGAGVRSDAVVVRTFQSVPSGAPDVQISPDSPTSFRISWSELPKSQRNGIITQYKVSIETGINRIVIKLPGDKLEYLETGLEQGRPYKVQVLAGTTVGFPTNIEYNWIAYSTPMKVDGDIPTPVLVFKPINSTSVSIGWDIDKYNNMDSYRIMIKELLESVPVGEYNLSGMENECIVTGLKNRTFYEVDFLVKRRSSNAVKSVKELYQSLEPGDFPEPPPPMVIKPQPVSSTQIKLLWEEPKSMMVINKYTIRYQQRIAEEMVIRDDMINFFDVDSTTTVIQGLQPYTWYFISVKSHTENIGGPYSRPVLIQTLEGIPSPPENILAEVVSPGTVKLKWGPPSKLNGVITYYIVYYNSDKNVPDNSWTSIQQNGSTTTMVVEDLTSKVYYFKLRACTNAGEGKSSDIIEINTLNCEGKECPICEPPQSCVPTKDHERLTTLFEQRLGIVIGCAVGLVCIVICSVFVIIKHRQLRARFVQNANVHLMNTSNGQNVGRYLSEQPVGHSGVNENSYSPILHRLPENEDSDSKGGDVGIDRRNGRLSSHNGPPRNFSRNHEDYSSEHRALLSAGTSSSSQSNETSEELTPVTGMLDSNSTSPDVEFEIYYHNKKRNCQKHEGALHDRDTPPPTKKHFDDLGHVGMNSIEVSDNENKHFDKSDGIQTSDMDLNSEDSPTVQDQRINSGTHPSHD